ncbi:MAG: preprotein translocase subunit SecE [Mycoplasma sp.]|nr:preprotein translocase subunit SecE [Mycoplasma sp.]
MKQENKDKVINSNNQIDINHSNDINKEQIAENEVVSEHHPDKEKAYPVRNFFKELKRVSWPTSKKNYKYFFLVFVFIIFLVIFFALISWCVSELWKWMGVS